jgi:hypothetical protein
MSFAPRATESPRTEARGLVGLAAILAFRGTDVIGAEAHISAAALDDYLAAAHQRQRRWTRRLRQGRRAADQPSATRACLEEIFVTEALACVWGALVVGHEQQQNYGGQGAKVVSRVALAHAETRQRAMHLLACRSALTPQDAAELDRLRRSMARWIDLLVAHVQQGFTVDVSPFAVEPERACEFADDLRHQQASGVAAPAVAVSLTSLRSALDEQVRCPSPNADLNHAIATSVLSCLAPEIFDATGPYHALWTIRLTHRAADAERMVASLLEE